MKGAGEQYEMPKRFRGEEEVVETDDDDTNTTTTG
jgi:hypothetical protein